MALVIHPVALSVGPITIHWYGIILGVGALLGYVVAMREGKKRFNINPDFFMDLLLIGVPVSVLFARIYYVAFRWPYYQHHPSEMFQIWEGGLAIHGALIGAVLTGIIYVRVKGYNFWRIADIAAPGLIVGQIIGRWGNYVNQEAYGGPVSESFLRETLYLPSFIVDQMYIEIEGAYHHPTFFYEFAWNVAGLLLLLFLRRRSFMRAGEVFMSYLIWYSIGRFFIEGLRTDSLAFSGPVWLENFMNALWWPMVLLFGEQGSMEPGFGNIRTAQMIGLLIIVGAVVLMFIRRSKGYANARYLDPIYSTKQSHDAGNAEKATVSGTTDPTAEERLAGNTKKAKRSGGGNSGTIAEGRVTQSSSDEEQETVVNPVTGAVIRRTIRRPDAPDAEREED